MFFRFRKSNVEPLPLTMIGVRLGERLLQIGLDDPALAAALAAKAGMSGTAVLVVNNEKDAQRGRNGAAKAGTLLDVKVVTPLRNLPFDDDAFDVIVFHSMSGLLAQLAPYTRVRCLEECFRTLRPGGRLIVIEPEPRGGLAGLIHAPSDAYYASGGGAVGALRTEGFKPVRILADREGFRFTEGLKTVVPAASAGAES